MPNTGKHSTGCFSCRRMKIRCDENKPSCLRCLRVKRTCPGYADCFRIEDPSTKRRQRRALNTTYTISEIHGTQTSVPLLIRRIDTTIDGWYDRAWKLFFHGYTESSTKSGPEEHCLDSLETHCALSHRKSYLLDAINAAALANLSYRVPHLKWVTVNTLLHYARALNGIKSAISNEKDAGEDDVLIALWCIEKVELINGLQDAAQNHCAGLSSVIRCHSGSQASTEPGAQLITAINLQLMVRDCLFGTKFHLPLDISYPERLHLYSETARLSAEYSALVTGYGGTSAETLAQKAIILDNRLQLMVQDFAPIQDTNEILLGKFRLTTSYFARIIDAVPWLYYHAMRLRILRIATLSSNIPCYITENIEEEILAIASLIPALLGQNRKKLSDEPMRFQSAGAIFAMHACSSVLNSPEIYDPDLRQWTLGQYNKIGNDHGIKEAFAFQNYFSSGEALPDRQMIWATAHSQFPQEAPVLISGHKTSQDTRPHSALIPCV